jgi:hypothetical protein
MDYYPVAVAEPSAESAGGTRLKDDDIDHDSAIEPSEHDVIHDYISSSYYYYYLVEGLLVYSLDDDDENEDKKW